MTKYKCGHTTKAIFIDNNILSRYANLDWAETVGREGTKELCWECWCEK